MVDKRPIGYNPNKPYVLDQKVKKNPKYAHITSSINTGLHSDNIRIMSNKAIVNRKKELFKRIKPSTVANFMRKEKNFENIYNLIETSNIQSPSSLSVENRFGNKSLVSKHDYPDNLSQSHVSVVTYATEQLGFNSETEYVIADLREPDEYELYHIKEAINYPGPEIGRDKFPLQIMNLKNKHNKFIIIYHNDEKHGIPYAAGMYEKGYDNVYLISGGIEEFLKDAHDLVEGKNVPSPTKKSKDNFVYKRSLFREYPEEGDVVLPMNHYTEEDQSTVSNVFSTKSGKSKKTLGLNSSRMSKAISAHILKHKGL